MIKWNTPYSVDIEKRIYVKILNMVHFILSFFYSTKIKI
mgnify:CR=1 FL=1